MMTITIIISNDWVLNSMDVEKAFLQSKSLKREVSVQPPKEAAVDSGTVWRLKKAAYGLGGAAKEWYETLSKVLLSMGLKKSRNDPALFYYEKNGKVKEIMAVHVDDFLFGGDKDFENLMGVLKKKIVISTHIKNCFKFCGLQIITKEYKTFEITLADSKVNSIEKMNRIMGPRGRKITSFEETMVRSRIGSMQWFAATCRPDLCVMLNSILARVNSTKDYSYISSVNTAVDRFQRCQENKLMLVPLKGKICIEAYGDSAFDESNQIGYCLVLRQEKTQKVNFIGCRSIKSDRKAWSTLAAETHAMQYVMDRAIGMKALFHELGLKNTPTTILTDNLSLNKVL